MAVNIELKRSAVPGKIPSTSQLQLGELAVNTYDGKIYFKKNVSGTESILTIATSAGTGSITVDSASFAFYAANAGTAQTATTAPGYTLLTTFNGFTSSYYNDSSSFNSRILNNSSSITYLSSSFLVFSSSYNTGSFTGSFTGSHLGNLTGTASYATQALTASYVLNAISSSYSLSSSYATTASYVTLAQTASYVVTAQTASYVLNAVSSSYATTASYVQTAQTASYVLQAVSASYSTLAQTANTASYVVLAQTASYVITAQTASYVLGSNVNGTVANATNAVTAQTASYVLNAVSASYALSSSYAYNSTTASYAINATTAQTASYATNFTASNILVIGTVTAQTLNVQTVTSSIIYSSGSNTFGNSLTNTQQFTGSVTVTGSLSVNGSPVILTNQTSSMTVLSSSYAITASYAQNASNITGLLAVSNGGTGQTTLAGVQSWLGLGTAAYQPATQFLNVLPSNTVTDLNTVVSNSAAWISGSANAPSTYGLLNVYRTLVGGDWQFQQAFGTDGNVYQRQYINSGTFTSWREYVFADQLGTNAYNSTAYLPLAGGTTTGLINFNQGTYIPANYPNTINSQYSMASDGGDLWVNYNGYQNGASYYRNFNIGNGKNTSLVWVQGANGHVNIGAGQSDLTYKLGVYGTLGVIGAFSSNPTNFDAGQILVIANGSYSGENRMLSFGQINGDSYMRVFNPQSASGSTGVFRIMNSSTVATLMYLDQSGTFRFYTDPSWSNSAGIWLTQQSDNMQIRMYRPDGSGNSYTWYITNDVGGVFNLKYGFGAMGSETVSIKAQFDTNGNFWARDLNASRNNGSGVVYFGNSQGTFSGTSTYLYYDGTKFIFNNGAVQAPSFNTLTTSNTLQSGYATPILTYGSYGLALGGIITIKATFSNAVTTKTYIISSMGGGLSTGLVEVSNEDYGGSPSPFDLYIAGGNPTGGTTTIFLYNAANTTTTYTVSYASNFNDLGVSIPTYSSTSGLPPGIIAQKLVKFINEGWQPYIPTSAGYDLNNLTRTFDVFFGNPNANGFTGQDSFTIRLGNGDNTGRGWQLGADSTTVYTRVKNSSSGGAWTPWYALLNSNNYNAYTPKLDGTGASGTWPISISGNAASATTTTYWSNQLADLTAAGTGTIQWLAGSNGDGYVRPYFLSLIQSFLGLGSNAYTSTSYLPLTGGSLTGVLTSNSDISTTTNFNAGNTGYVAQLLGGSTNNAVLINVNNDNTKWIIGSNVGFQNVSQNRNLNFNYSNGTSWTNLLNITPAGDATFNGNVNVNSNTFNLFNASTNSSIFSNYNNSNIVRLVAASNGNGYVGVSAGSGSLAIGVTSNPNSLLFDNTGAATFSSSVTATGFFNSSDLYLKNIINQYTTKSFGIVEYTWKDGRDNKTHLGYIAQEVEKFLPSAVMKDGRGYLTVNYHEAHAYKIRELELRIQVLEDKLKKYERWVGQD